MNGACEKRAIALLATRGYESDRSAAIAGRLIGK